jgi:Eukaryotic membrane protein family
MFVIALVYNVIHAAALLYQVITLNVAVNSYSNALLTLLMSNQFVEIKGAVFKKVEKENLFQLTCADVVERFQLWLMLLIIAMRNVVEIGGLSINSSGLETMTSGAASADATGVPTSTSSILPQAFTLLPRLSGQVLGPFLVVLGIEMLVDWLKHAYVTKFNDTQPAIYSRFLDLLARDYYTQAFGDRHDLTRRIGLPVLPLACLFVRSAVQTYQMFVAAHAPSGGLPAAAAQPLASAKPGAGAALAHVDAMLRRAFVGSGGQAAAAGSGLAAAGDWLAATLLVVVVCLVAFLALLGAKLALGLVLLRWARGRQPGMREREAARTDVGSRRLGINGMVEVDDEKRRWIYDGDEAGLARLREKERDRERDRERGRGGDLGAVTRYAMVAKRIW